MVEINYWAVLVAAFIPLILGFVWYNPNVFGKAWMRAAEVSEDKLKQGNMAKVFAITFILSFLIALSLNPIVVHQFGALGMVGGDPKLGKPSYEVFVQDYGLAFRSFKHGFLHGLLTGFFLVFPIIGINALFERKSWKYILINSGYWILCLAIMGGIISGWYNAGHFNFSTVK